MAQNGLERPNAEHLKPFKNHFKHLRNSVLQVLSINETSDVESNTDSPKDIFYFS